MPIAPGPFYVFRDASPQGNWIDHFALLLDWLTLRVLMVGVPAAVWIEMLSSVAAFLLLSAVFGYALLKASGRAACAEDLGLALGLGYSVLPALVLVEGYLGHSVLVLPLALGACVFVGRDWRAISGRRLAVALALPLLLGAFAAFVDLGDVRFLPEGIAFRSGFDVSDKAYYALVARQVALAPPPWTSHPFFAGMPCPMSFFVCLSGLLLHVYAGATLTTAFLLSLPVAAMIFAGATAAGLARECGLRDRTAALAVLLVVLGGDLAFLLQTADGGPLLRTRFVFVFHTASAESLLLNSWMFGLPAVFAALTAAARWLRGRRFADLALCGLLAGAVFETKPFGYAPLVAGAFAAALLRRNGRLAQLGLAWVVGGLPWIALTLAFGREGGTRFFLWPLAHVGKFLNLTPVLAPLAREAFAGVRPWSTLAWALAASLFVAGGLGFRLLGVPRLVSAARSDASGFHSLIAASIAAALIAGHLLGTWPLPADGGQFFIVAAALLWFYAAPAFADALGARHSRPLAILALAMALVTPLVYVATKRLPELLTPPSAIDRQYLLVPHDAVAACRFLREHSRPADRLVVRFDSPARVAPELFPFYVSLLSGRSLVGSLPAFNVPMERVRPRLDGVAGIYSNPDAAAAEQFLADSHTRWVWEDASSALAFSSPHLRPAFADGRVRIYEFRP